MATGSRSCTYSLQRNSWLEGRIAWNGLRIRLLSETSRVVLEDTLTARWSQELASGKALEMQFDRIKIFVEATVPSPVAQPPWTRVKQYRVLHPGLVPRERSAAEAPLPERTDEPGLPSPCLHSPSSWPGAAGSTRQRVPAFATPSPARLRSTPAHSHAAAARPGPTTTALDTSAPLSDAAFLLRERGCFQAHENFPRKAIAELRQRSELGLEWRGEPLPAPSRPERSRSPAALPQSPSRQGRSRSRSAHRAQSPAAADEQWSRCCLKFWHRKAGKGYCRRDGAEDLLLEQSALRGQDFVMSSSEVWVVDRASGERFFLRPGSCIDYTFGPSAAFRGNTGSRAWGWKVVRSK